MLDLAAFYAPRGITPEDIRRMSLADRAVLRVGRARYYDDAVRIVAAGISMAYGSEEADNGEK